MASKRKQTKRRRTTVERKHEVKVKIENFTLAKAKSALTLQIYSREEKLGELQVGRGSLYWWGANRQKENRVPWDLFAAMMNKLVYGDE